MLNGMAYASDNFTRRVLIAVTITISVLLLLALLWYAVDVLLIAFAGLLLGIFLRGLSDLVSSCTALSDGWSLAAVTLTLVLLLVAGGWLLAPDIAAQIDELRTSLPQSMRQLAVRIERYQWGRQLLAQLPSADDLLSDKTRILTRFTGVFSSTLGAFANFFIIIALGLYLALEPQLYTSGFIRLVPLARRARVREILAEISHSLRWWLIGQVFSMIIIGLLTALGLWLLGVPLALTLGLLAALLTFMPNLGPLLAVVPAALLALLQSPTRALYVLLLYLGIQAVETYLLTPMLQKRTIALPPAFIIFAQVLLGILLGGLGLVLSVPLTAAAFVLVKTLYVEDTLNDVGAKPDIVSDQTSAAE